MIPEAPTCGTSYWGLYSVLGFFWFLFWELLLIGAALEYGRTAQDTTAKNHGGSHRPGLNPGSILQAPHFWPLWM